MDSPLETADLLAFTKIVDAKSISRAAAELGVPRATIGRRLSQLEERLGARLLRRSTRSLALTDAGEALYRHARLVLEAVERAEASVRRESGSLRGDLRVSVPPIVDERFFALLTDFAQKHPDVRLEAHFASRHVDLRRDGYDVAIRAATDLEPGLVARTLSRGRVIGVASSAYVAIHGTPRSAKDLAHHRCLMGFARGELPQTQWPVGGARVRVDGSFFSNDVKILLFAALRGLGIAFLPEQLVTEHLTSGELVVILPGLLETPNRLAVVYAERELVPPQVKAFVEAVVAWAPGSSLAPAANAARLRKKAQ